MSQKVEEFMAALNAITAEVPKGTNPVDYLVLQVYRGRQDLKRIQDLNISKMRERETRIARRNIAGICQSAAFDLQWWADNEIRTEEERDDCIETLLGFINRIKKVQLNYQVPEEV